MLMRKGLCKKGGLLHNFGGYIKYPNPNAQLIADQFQQQNIPPISNCIYALSVVNFRRFDNVDNILGNTPDTFTSNTINIGTEVTVNFERAIVIGDVISLKVHNRSTNAVSVNFILTNDGNALTSTNIIVQPTIDPTIISFIADDNKNNLRLSVTAIGFTLLFNIYTVSIC